SPLLIVVGNGGLGPLIGRKRGKELCRRLHHCFASPGELVIRPRGSPAEGDGKGNERNGQAARHGKAPLGWQVVKQYSRGEQRVVSRGVARGSNLARVRESLMSEVFWETINFSGGWRRGSDSALA